MGLLIIIIAAFCAAIASLCMRKSIDMAGSSRGYLAVQFSFSLLVVIFLNPLRSGDFSFYLPTFLCGLTGGILLGLLMFCIGKAVESGLSSLTFAIINAATIAPALIMVVLFGRENGHPYTWFNAIGALFVLIGFFWASRTYFHNWQKRVWITFVVSAFICNALFLAYLQWWALIVKPNTQSSSLLSLHIDGKGIEWFTPAILISGMVIQWIIFFARGPLSIVKKEWRIGAIGGVINGLCAYFMVLAPQVASSWENPLLFPVFATTIVLVCNVWAQVLYKEKINWVANAIAITGILIGSLSLYKH